MKTKVCTTGALVCFLTSMMFSVVGFTSAPGDSDAIDIRTAECTSSTSTLQVKATSSKQGAQLTVFRTSDDVRIGALVVNKDRQYEGEFIVDACPERITVKSNGGGRAVADVEQK
ncbi:MAG TPA: hypothetical protein VFG50_15000 [Rhodothermales bacterium]|nr:hypothetical protein [Rhodothermales bacterium]